MSMNGEQNLYEVSVHKKTKTNVLPAFKMKVFADTVSDADSIIAEIAEQDGYKVVGGAVLIGKFNPDKQRVMHLDPELDLETFISETLDTLTTHTPGDT